MSDISSSFIVDYENYISNSYKFTTSQMQVFLKKMSEGSWVAPLWIPGRAQRAPNDQVLFSLLFAAAEDGERPILDVYPTIEMAEELADEYVQVNMAIICGIILDKNFADLRLFANNDEYYNVTHEQAQRLRYLMGLNGEPPETAEEIDVKYLIRLNTLLDNLVGYCKSHKDIRTFHTCIGLMGAAPAALIVHIGADEDTGKHVKAFEALHQDIMQPGDKLIFLDQSTEVMATLMSTPIMYDREQSKKWFSCFKKRAEIQAISMSLY